MIRGLARFFQVYSDDQIVLERLDYVLGSYGPMNIVGRAQDKKKVGGHGHSAGYELARVVAELYNRRYDGKKLPLRALDSKTRK